MANEQSKPEAPVVPVVHVPGKIEEGLVKASTDKGYVPPEKRVKK